MLNKIGPLSAFCSAVLGHFTVDCDEARVPCARRDSLNKLRTILDEHPELNEPDYGTVLFELGVACQKRINDLENDEWQANRQMMLDALQGALTWRENYLGTEDQSTDMARYSLASGLLDVYQCEQDDKLRDDAVSLLKQVYLYRKNAGDKVGLYNATVLLVKAYVRDERYQDVARDYFHDAQMQTKEVQIDYSVAYIDYKLYNIYQAAGGKRGYFEWINAGRPECDLTMPG